MQYRSGSFQDWPITPNFSVRNFIVLSADPLNTAGKDQHMISHHTEAVRYEERRKQMGRIQQTFQYGTFPDIHVEYLPYLVFRRDNRDGTGDSFCGHHTEAVRYEERRKQMGRIQPLELGEPFPVKQFADGLEKTELGAEYILQPHGSQRYRTHYVGHVDDGPEYILKADAAGLIQCFDLFVFSMRGGYWIEKE